MELRAFRGRTFFIGLISAVLVAFTITHITFAATSVIHPGDLDGWGFTQESGAAGDATGAFVLGPGVPPLGSGSAHMTLADPAAGMVLGALLYTGLAFSEIDTLSYSTYVDPGSSSTVQSIALQFNADDDVTDADTSWKGRLVFEPYYTETITKGIWQTWDPKTVGKWWGTGATIAASCSIGSPCTWSELLTAFPNVGVNSSFGGVLFKAGSGWPAGFDGNVDAFTIVSSANGIDDTYDFEVDPPTLTKSQILEDSGVPGKGVSNAPGLQKEFNPKSKASERAGKK